MFFTEQEEYNGQMAMFTRDNLKMVSIMEMVNSNGLTLNFTIKGSSERAKCMALEYL
jgi:hypothetical protein